MSYAYLFKYIIIGDTGKSLSPPFVLDPLKPFHLHTLSILFDLTSPYCRCRKVLLTPLVHGQALQTAARSDHRGRVRSANHSDQLEKHQIANLGHRKYCCCCCDGHISIYWLICVGWPGELQEHHSLLLQGGRRRSPSLRYHEARHV